MLGMTNDFKVLLRVVEAIPVLVVDMNLARTVESKNVLVHLANGSDSIFPDVPLSVDVIPVPANPPRK